jgi:signal transduction histidine kinase
VYTRLRTAEAELATLGNAPDPYLEYLLKQFGQEAIARRELGEDSLQLLYRSWVNSGLAREAVPARITLWDGQGKPQMQLPLGDAFSSPAERLETIPDYLAETFVRVQELAHPEVFRAHDVDVVNQMLVVPLDQHRMITVEVPPRRTFERASVIAPLLGARADLTTRLELVPSSTTTQGGVWRPTEDGWRSEAHVRFPDGDYHAHLRVRLPQLGVLVARGVLLIAADLLIFVLLWLAGRAWRGEKVAPAGGWLSVFGSFRARITVALLAFFLLPTVVFGLVAYRALAREVERAARIVAERAVQQAVIEFSDSRVSNLRELSAHTGEEILQYFNGELINVSSPEALELGVYNAWLPANVAETLESGEAEADIATRQIGEQEFLTAYRRLPVRNTGVMAVPVSLESAETVARQREMAHLIMFAALVGVLLSVGLSVEVGRALAGPMGRLQRAAAAVGAGRLRVRLPEHTRDEFGKLFASFNRMARRLQRARAQEARSARVLAWGEMARQVAHEIKNPLTPIKLSVQHLRRAHTDGRPDFPDILDRSVEQILIEIDRLTEIARAFSRYGAPAESAGPLEPVNVGTVVHEALTLYRTGDAQLRYDDDIEPSLPAVLSRPGELKEVILNLLENARNATPAGGRIAVLAYRQNGSVELSVQDNGIGIAPHLLNRIFEPHFSTRTTGTGLGLPIVRRLVESWGGDVTAESEAGHGTTIRVRLQMAALVAAD